MPCSRQLAHRLAQLENAVLLAAFYSNNGSVLHRRTNAVHDASSELSVTERVVVTHSPRVPRQRRHNSAIASSPADRSTPLQSYSVQARSVSEYERMSVVTVVVVGGVVISQQHRDPRGVSCFVSSCAFFFSRVRAREREWWVV